MENSWVVLPLVLFEPMVKKKKKKKMFGSTERMQWKTKDGKYEQWMTSTNVCVDVVVLLLCFEKTGKQEKTG